MGASVSSEEVVLILVYTVALFLLVRKFLRFDWRIALFAAAIVGVRTGEFIWPWAFIVFGWPGASLGEVTSSALGLNAPDLIWAGALCSASVAMSIIALGVTLLLLLPITMWNKLARNWTAARKTDT